MSKSYGKGIGGIRPRQFVRVTGPHMVRTEVETFDEALELLARHRVRGKTGVKPKMPWAIAKAIAVQARAPLSLAGRIEERKPRKVKPLAQSGRDPKPFHIQCGRCGRPRDEAIKGDCGLLTRCLGKLLNG